MLPQNSRAKAPSGLRSLNALGLIESRDGSGAFVTKRSSESVGEILRVVLFHSAEAIDEIYEGCRVIESWGPIPGACPEERTTSEGRFVVGGVELQRDSMSRKGRISNGGRHHVFS